MANATTSTIYITSARLARGYVTASVSSETATTATISWTIKCQQQSAALYGQEAQCFVDGGYVASCEGYITSSSSSWKDVCSKSGTTTVNKTTSSQSVPVAIATRMATVDGYGSVTTDWYWATCYVSVSAKTSYTVSYNANGGSGAPSKQTKWHGTNLTLSTTKPTRTGYTFLGWATSSTATSANSSYDPGDTYSTNAALTLYAVWKANTYTVSYNANGGSGAPSNQTKTYGVNLTLSSTKPTRTNYNFLGWGISASATTVAYAAGATYSANSAITLYAIWELAYWKPKITNLTVTRCNSAGTADEYGTYAKISFGWELCQLLGTNTTATIAISWTGSSASGTGSGTSGTFSKVVGSGALSIESPYTFTVKVTDNTDNTSLDVTLPASSFAIDFKAGGTGVNFGAPAEADGFHCAWPATFDRVHITNTTDSAGTADNDVALIIGTRSGAHISMDTNEINAKASGTTVAQLNLNANGGLVSVGSGGLYANGVIETKNYNSFGSQTTNGDFRSLALINSSNNTYFGHGSYTNSEGSTYYEGNTVRINSKGHIYMTAPSAGLSARQFGVNKVLWSGGAYMNENQTITLSEAISAQPNGIVLVWSWYSTNNTAENFDWIYNFIPKWAAVNQANNGFQIAGFGVDGHMAKYIYPTDTTLRGYTYNDEEFTKGNATFYNNRYVLRYVIGV